MRDAAAVACPWRLPRARGVTHFAAATIAGAAGRARLLPDVRATRAGSHVGARLGRDRRVRCMCREDRSRLSMAGARRWTKYPMRSLRAACWAMDWRSILERRDCWRPATGNFDPAGECARHLPSHRGRDRDTDSYRHRYGCCSAGRGFEPRVKPGAGESGDELHPLRSRRRGARREELDDSHPGAHRRRAIGAAPGRRTGERRRLLFDDRGPPRASARAFTDVASSTVQSRARRCRSAGHACPARSLDRAARQGR